MHSTASSYLLRCPLNYWMSLSHSVVGNEEQTPDGGSLFMVFPVFRNDRIQIKSQPLYDLVVHQFKKHTVWPSNNLRGCGALFWTTVGTSQRLRPGLRQCGRDAKQQTSDSNPLLLNEDVLTCIFYFYTSSFTHLLHHTKMKCLADQFAVNMETWERFRESSFLLQDAMYRGVGGSWGLLGVWLQTA